MLNIFIATNLLIGGFFCILGAQSKLPKLFQKAWDTSYPLSKKLGTIVGVLTMLGGIRTLFENVF